MFTYLDAQINILRAGTAIFSLDSTQSRRDSKVYYECNTCMPVIAYLNSCLSFIVLSIFYKNLIVPFKFILVRLSYRLNKNCGLKMVNSDRQTDEHYSIDNTSIKRNSACVMFAELVHLTQAIYI